MLESSSRGIVELLEDGASVLDIRGWAKPFPPANRARVAVHTGLRRFGI